MCVVGDFWLEQLLCVNGCFRSGAATKFHQCLGVILLFVDPIDSAAFRDAGAQLSVPMTSSDDLRRRLWFE